MSKTTFKVSAKDKKESNKQLRKDGILPANVYGAGEKSRMIKVQLKNFIKLHEEVGETGLVYLKIDDEKKEHPVLVDEVQLDGITDNPIHVTFKQVDLKEKITAEIPIELVGEFDLKEAVLVTVRDTIEVEALPTDLPEKFEIKIEELTEIGQAIHLKDLKYDHSKVELVVGEEGLDAPVVLVQEVKEEVEEEVVVVVEEPVEGEEGAEEAGEETPAEGEAKKGETPAVEKKSGEKAAS